MRKLSNQYEGVELNSIADKELRKFVKIEREKEELRKIVKIISHDELQELINKYRTTPLYRKTDVKCQFYVPTPNFYGEPIIGEFKKGGLGMRGSIDYRLESMRAFGERLKKWETFPFVTKNGQNNTTEENDLMIKEQLSPKLFGNFIGRRMIKVHSVLKDVIANIEYDMEVSLPTEMNEQEEREYINSYLQTDEVKELIYGSINNIKSFEFGSVDEKWEVV
jgi:hypothetical protein